MPFDSAWLPADLLARAREAVYHSATLNPVNGRSHRHGATAY